MARRLVFDPDAWQDYLHWQSQDARMLARVNQLIRECKGDPFRGIGKPEPLRGKLTGCWSRRIDDTHRFVYRIADNDIDIDILACRYHYGAR